jgi:hypothetical protein
MNTVEQLQQERTRIMQEMLNISCARKGSVTEQYFPVMKDGAPTNEKRGPYWIFSTKQGGKTVSKRLTTSTALAHARREISNHRQLQELFHRFEELTEQLGILAQELSLSEEALKKGLNSQRKKAGKSRTS